jgi:hypothetical protein
MNVSLINFPEIDSLKFQKISYLKQLSLVFILFVHSHSTDYFL